MRRILILLLAFLLMDIGASAALASGGRPSSFSLLCLALAWLLGACEWLGSPALRRALAGLVALVLGGGSALWLGFTALGLAATTGSQNLGLGGLAIIVLVLYAPLALLGLGVAVALGADVIREERAARVMDKERSKP